MSESGDRIDVCQFPVLKGENKCYDSLGIANKTNSNVCENALKIMHFLEMEFCKLYIFSKNILAVPRINVAMHNKRVERVERSSKPK